MINSKAKNATPKTHAWGGNGLLNEDPVIESRDHETPGIAIGCAFAFGVLGVFLLCTVALIYLTIGFLE